MLIPSIRHIAHEVVPHPSGLAGPGRNRLDARGTFTAEDTIERKVIDRSH